jgi:hypothetical protein
MVEAPEIVDRRLADLERQIDDMPSSTE